MAEARRPGVAAWAPGEGEAGPALANLLLVLADNKYQLGWRVSEWAVGAPSLEAAVAVAAVAQGELGQARVLYPLLTDLGFPGPVDRSERARGASVAALDGPLPTWADAVAALLLVDTALTVLLEALERGAWEALARRVPRMLEEEAFHADFARGRARELVAIPGGREALGARTAGIVEEMLCWFGPAGEPGVATLRREGLLGADGPAMRQTYLDRVAPVLHEVGAVPVPGRDAATGRRDDRSLPWERWNPRPRRLEPATGQPATRDPKPTV